MTDQNIKKQISPREFIEKYFPDEAQSIHPKLMEAVEKHMKIKPEKRMVIVSVFRSRPRRSFVADFYGRRN